MILQILPENEEAGRQGPKMSPPPLGLESLFLVSPGRADTAANSRADSATADVRRTPQHWGM